MVMRPDVVDARDRQRVGARRRSGGRSSACRRAAGRSTRRGAGARGGPGVTLLCGRYEGVDERVIEARRLEEVSLGDFVLSGGEPAAIALIDACVRLLPGVIGAEAALEEESFETGLLEYPHYTRPPVWQGRDGAGGAAVRPSRADRAPGGSSEAEEITRERRPDLWARY